MWALILILGSWWTLKAPIVLSRRGGHLRPAPKAGDSRYARFFMTPQEKDARDRRREVMMKREGGYYTPSSEEGDNLMVATMRSLPKSERRGSAGLSLREERGGGGSGGGGGGSSLNIAGPLWAGGVAGRTAQQASAAWTQREIDSRHHFIIVRSLAVPPSPSLV